MRGARSSQSHDFVELADRGRAGRMTLDEVAQPLERVRGQPIRADATEEREAGLGRSGLDATSIQLLADPVDANLVQLVEGDDRIACSIGEDW